MEGEVGWTHLASRLNAALLLSSVVGAPCLFYSLICACLL